MASVVPSDVIGQAKTTPKYPALFNPRSRRLHIALLSMFGFFTLTLMNTNLGIALVCMVKVTTENSSSNASLHSSNETKNDGCVLAKYAAQDYEGTLDWSPAKQALLFSATFWGGFVTVLPAGWLAEYYGPKRMLIIATVFELVPTLLTPLFANYVHYWAVFAARLMLGLGFGLLVPTMSMLIAQWFPALERSSVVAVSTAGNQLAGVLGSPISALFCKSIFGWSAIFYASGLTGIVWLLSCIFLVTDTPSECKSMSVNESAYLERTLSPEKNTRANRKQIRVPWKRLLLSLPFFAIMIVQFGVNFNLYLLQAYLPTYFKDVLFLDLKSNGYYTAMPFLVQMVFKFVWGAVADKTKQAKLASPTIVTKFFNSLCCFGSALTLIGLAFTVDCHQSTLALVLLCVQGAALASLVGGYMTSMLCIAPMFTGTLAALGMTSGFVGSFAAPIVVGAISQNSSIAEWRTIFLITAGLLIISGVVFLLFSSAEVQPWAVPVLAASRQAVVDKVDADVSKSASTINSDITTVST